MRVDDIKDIMRSGFSATTFVGTLGVVMQIAGASPRRIGLVICGDGTTTGQVGPTRDIGPAKGIILSAASPYREYWAATSGPLCQAAWFFVPTGANMSVTVIEVEAPKEWGL